VASAAHLLIAPAHSLRRSGLPSRSSYLLDEFRQSGRFASIRIVNRRRPTDFARLARPGRPMTSRGLPAVRTRLADGSMLIEHPWPFGRLENRLLAGLAADRARRPLVLWLADPKSATAFRGMTDAGILRVFDAFDAWDLSPLVRGDRRQAAVRSGYRAIAEGADIVFANTEAMAERFRAAGAGHVVLVPNASPRPDLRQPSNTPFVVYVGRIHERFDAELAAAVADELGDVPLRIVGPVERTPAGWDRLVARRNVEVVGAMAPARALSMIGEARALVLPHVVDDYTRSQDAMKAWDALSVGTPVVSTPIPPVDGWPAMGGVAVQPAAFPAAVVRFVEDEDPAARAQRVELAARNGWADRARTMLDVIDRCLADLATREEPSPEGVEEVAPG
jgi:glycosyltransferase involved in cell wall biosynthesis